MPCNTTAYQTCRGIEMSYSLLVCASVSEVNYVSVSQLNASPLSNHINP